MVIQKFLPRFLIFIWGCISLTIIDFGGVFEVDVVKHVAGDVVCSVRRLRQEPISVLEFHFGMFSFEYLLKGEAFNAVSNSSHDRAREEVTHEGRYSCFFKSGWFRDSDFLRSWRRWDPWGCAGLSDWRGRVQNIVSSAFVYGRSFMRVYQDVF